MSPEPRQTDRDIYSEFRCATCGVMWINHAAEDHAFLKITQSPQVCPKCGTHTIPNSGFPGGIMCARVGCGWSKSRREFEAESAPPASPKPKEAEGQGPCIHFEKDGLWYSKGFGVSRVHNTRGAAYNNASDCNFYYTQGQRSRDAKWEKLKILLPDFAARSIELSDRQLLKYMMKTVTELEEAQNVR